MQYFIDVILPIPLEKQFTYSITKAEVDYLKQGIRVAVPFGKTKIYTGLVYKIHEDAPTAYEAKEIHQILDENPIVNPNQFKLWEWISKYYMCTLGEVMRAALPSAFILESETIISLNNEIEHDDEQLKDDEFLVVEALHHQSSLKIQDITSIIDKKNALPVIKRLFDRNAIKLREEIFEKYKPKKVRYIKLNRNYDSEESLHQLLDNLNRAPKQRELLFKYFTLKSQLNKPVKVKSLLKQTGISSSVLKGLITKEIFEEYHLVQDRIMFSGSEKQSTKSLNSHQKEALNKIRSLFKTHNVTLLKGVTSSGKTEIYSKLIEESIDKGQQVLYLLPEIALTAQLVSRMQSYFGENISVYHSKYSLNERVEVWNNMLKNSDKTKIILGARSAIFLPFKNIGSIIVDEEHELSYKQFDPAPRYHARDSAIVLASLFNARTILGSATPSLESYYNSKENKYGLVELTKRYNDVLMPEIEIVDLKDKYRRKRMKGHFSDRLIEEMKEALGEDHQIILFQNRRGYSPIIECKTCGHSPQCPNCDVSLTYHQKIDQLRCHYCGFNMKMLTQCLACNSPILDTKGFGTEQLEQEVRQLFPDIKVARMDLDTTRGKYSHQKIIARFEDQEIDVLVGTQMVTKGLDFRNVKLVGIMNADNMLNFPDFRAHERSFQMMMQVSGRAGRTEKRGLVLIQSYNPHHKILQQVSMNDYQKMFDEQLNDRYNFKYPPIYRIIKITLKHKDYNRVNESSDWMAKSLRQIFPDFVLGPEFPPIARIRNQYQKNILIKIPPRTSLVKTKEAILKIKNSFLSVKDFRSVKVILNVDSY